MAALEAGKKRENNIKIGSAVSRLLPADKRARQFRSEHRLTEEVAAAAAATTRGPFGRCSPLPLRCLI